MTNPFIQIDDEVREMTDEESQTFSQLQADALTDEQARNTSRASALAKLAALGLTEEEIAAL
jgi:DNA-binding NarL/FixJ family response regulator